MIERIYDKMNYIKVITCFQPVHGDNSASGLSYGQVDNHDKLINYVIYLFIYTIFQEGDILSSMASLPNGLLNI